MRKHYKTLLTAALPLLALLPGCKKGESAAPVSGFKMYNADTVKIHLDLYRNWDDYLTGENIYTSFDIKPKDSVTIPGDKLDAYNTYYFDWYSADYTHNNWVTNMLGDNSFMLATSYAHNCLSEVSYLKRSLLNGNQTQTHWVAVDAFNQQGISVYDTLSASKKLVDLTFHKDWTATKLTNSQDDIPRTVRLQLVSDNGPYFQIHLTEGGTVMNTSSHTFVASQIPTLDTLLFQYTGYNYLLVKK